MNPITSWPVASSATREIADFRDVRGGRDVGPGPLAGEELLAAVTEPVTAKSMMLGDDLLACVLGDVYTDVEKTMIELQRQRVVQEKRSTFRHVLEQRFISEVERLSGHHVLAFTSSSHVGPNLEIELFMLAPATDPDGTGGVSGWTRASRAGRCGRAS